MVIKILRGFKTVDMRKYKQSTHKGTLESYNIDHVRVPILCILGFALCTGSRFCLIYWFSVLPYVLVRVLPYVLVRVCLMYWFVFCLMYWFSVLPYVLVHVLPYVLVRVLPYVLVRVLPYVLVLGFALWTGSRCCLMYWFVFCLLYWFSVLPYLLFLGFVLCTGSRF